jgi:hypothetical protein
MNEYTQTGNGEIDVTVKASDTIVARAQDAAAGPAAALAPAPESQQRSAAEVLLLGLEGDPEIPALTIAGVKAALGANQMFYDKYDKKWVAEPDARTRLAAVEFVFKMLVGLPVQRSESRRVTVDATQATFEESLKSSPALRAALRRKLDATERALNT